MCLQLFGGMLISAGMDGAVAVYDPKVYRFLLPQTHLHRTTLKLFRLQQNIFHLFMQ